MAMYTVELSAYAIVTQSHRVEAGSAAEALEFVMQDGRYDSTWDYQGVEDETIEGNAWDENNTDDMAEELSSMGLQPLYDSVTDEENNDV